jgi:hypothetical protein
LQQNKIPQKYSVLILEPHKSVPRDIEPKKTRAKQQGNTLLESCYLYGKTKIAQRYSIHMPEAHRYLPRDIEAKAKGGSNFSF